MIFLAGVTKEEIANKKLYFLKKQIEKKFRNWSKRDKKSMIFFKREFCAKKQQFKKGACGCGISKHVHILEKCIVI